MYLHFPTRLHDVRIELLIFLFKESVIFPDCTASNNGMLSEYRMAKDVKGSAHEVNFEKYPGFYR